MVPEASVHQYEGNIHSIHDRKYIIHEMHYIQCIQYKQKYELLPGKKMVNNQVAMNYICITSCPYKRISEQWYTRIYLTPLSYAIDTFK
mgnify:FL=1